jgi:hypothetical protein
MKQSNLSSWATIVKYGVRLACLITIIYFVTRCLDASQDENISLKPTPVVIEEVKPIGELYAYTAITEEYDKYFMEDPGAISALNENIGVVLTMRAQVSYVLNLDSVTYEADDASDTVIVRIPRMRFVMDRQKSNLYGGTDRATNFDSSLRYDVIESYIRSHYDTMENYTKALDNAKAVLSDFVQRLNKIPKFIENY